MATTITSGMRAARMLSSPLRLTTLSTLASVSVTHSSATSIPIPIPASSSLPLSVPSFTPPSVPATSATTALMAQGKLLPTSLIDTLLFTRLSTLHSYILDGYPRTASQARTLVTSSSKPSTVIVLSAPDEVTLERISCRSEGRPDDTPEVAKDRLATYARSERDIINVFENANVNVVVVDAASSTEKVFQNMMQGLQEKSGNGNVVIMGPPGVGKGTQGKLLAQVSGAQHVSVGDIVRSHLQS